MRQFLLGFLIGTLGIVWVACKDMEPTGTALVVKTFKVDCKKKVLVIPIRFFPTKSKLGVILPGVKFENIVSAIKIEPDRQYKGFQRISRTIVRQGAKGRVFVVCGSVAYTEDTRYSIRLLLKKNIKK